MSTLADAVEQRKLRSIARRYERDGYRVTMPRQGGSPPAFLAGFTPDLIAESEHDRVVIEVKRSDAVRGSNNLVEIAERVSREPGWRFELVTIPSVEQSTASTTVRMAPIEDRARQVMSAGHSDVAFVYVSAVLDTLLQDLALKYGLSVTKAPVAQTARDLVSRGIISREIYDELEQARSVRNRIVHAQSEKRELPQVADVEALLALAKHLQSEMALATAG